MSAKPAGSASTSKAARRPGRISVAGRGDELLAARNDPRAPARLLRTGAGPTGQPLEGALLVPLDQVVADPRQPRQDWTHDDGERRLDELTASVREYGILQPLLVRQDGTLPDGRARYVIINGGRRRVAAERAGLEHVPLVVRGAEGARLRILQLIENLQRQALSPLDEARAYQEILDTEGISPPALSARLSLSAQHIRDRLRLLADQVVSDAVARRQITIKASRYLLQLPDEELHRFKEQIQRGIEVTYADIQGVRARLEANGVVNPRHKGGGHSRQKTGSTLALEAHSEQAGLVLPRPADPALPPPPAAGGEVDDVEQPSLPVPKEQAGLVPPPVVGDRDPARGPQVSGQVGDLADRHPATNAAVAEQLGVLIWQSLTLANRAQIVAQVRELSTSERLEDWWPWVYHGLTSQFPAGASTGTDD